MKLAPQLMLPVILLGGCAAAPASTYLGDPVAGARVSSELCASCHAVGLSGESPNSSAPPFRAVLNSYPPDVLAADLRNAVSISHLKMPTFYFGPEHADDIVAYLRTIQEPQP